jgi:O-6-methylguanine DNA methyltransferase
MTKASDFKERVLAIVRNIPKGKVMTYKEVAIAAGNPLASRAVGTVMRQNYDPTVPCHRVIRSDGKIGNYNRGGRERKIEILTSEGALSAS